MKLDKSFRFTPAIKQHKNVFNNTCRNSFLYIRVHLFASTCTFYPRN